MTQTAPSLEPAYRFLDGELPVADFEQWVYSTPDLEASWGPKVYLELVSIDFRSTWAEHEARKVLDTVIDFAAFELYDEHLPVVVAPLRSVGQEWRFVVVDREVVAGSGYLAEGRKAVAQAPDSEAWRFAARVASEMEPPEPVYVLDVCETPEGLRLLELNPFSGADLYACDLGAMVHAVGQFIEATS